MQYYRSKSLAGLHYKAKYKLKTYTNLNEPLVIFGMYREKDYEVLDAAPEADLDAPEGEEDDFTDVYLGAFATDPTLDNDGNALTAGDLYFNTGINRLKVYSGATWSTAVVDTTTVVEKTSTTGAAIIPAGTTGQRDAAPVNGYFRYNSSLASFEGYVGGAWGGVGGAQAGGVIFENALTISANYTLSTSKNGFSVGPITIGSGVTVTVPSSQRWVIL